MAQLLRNRQALTVAFAAALALSGTALGAEVNGFDEVEAQLRTIAPGAKTIALAETPIDGLLQAQVNNEIVYVSSDGAYLLTGNLIDIETRTNLTNEAKSVIRKGMIEDLDESEQIVFAPEHPAYDLLVFTDIDCGYCRRLHEQITEYMEQGIAIHYLAFPRAGIGSDSFDKYVSVWCAEDQQEALTLAKAGNEPEPLQCDNPVTEQYELGRNVGVTGTPALVTMQGELIPGYMPPAQLRERLDSMSGQQDGAP